MSDKTTLRSVTKSAEEDLREAIDDGWFDWVHPEDTLHEIADSAIPIYNSALLECASEDVWLATSEPDMGAGENAIDTIQRNIYEHVYQHLDATLQEIKEEREEAELEAEEDEE